MRTCAICGQKTSEETCPNDGEASWTAESEETPSKPPPRKDLPTKRTS